jgi:hypothetical protein
VEEEIERFLKNIGFVSSDEESPSCSNHFNPLKLKLVLIIFKHSFHASKKTQPISITRINWLMMFKEIITVYSENHMKPINILCGQNEELMIVKSGSKYSYYWPLKG